MATGELAGDEMDPGVTETIQEMSRDPAHREIEGLATSCVIVRQERVSSCVAEAPQCG